MPNFAGVAKRQGELIRKALANIIAVQNEDFELPLDFALTETASSVLRDLTTEGWEQLGWCSKSDGVTFAKNTETSTVDSFGAIQPTRTDITSDVTTAQFTCQETNKKVLEMYYNVDLTAVEGDAVTSEVAFNESVEPQTTYRRMLFLSKDGYGAREIYIAKVLPRASVTAKTDQSHSPENALGYGMTVTAEVDDEVGFAVRHIFGGPGWALLLTKMGFTKAVATP